ncbi:hypothetical protein D5F01_LYC09316 [Larimichthys crocea]|uniref:C2 domain-containing protein n=1 Tax=Larimichthys crocea TaxID=215358 RepID=A0A6G0IKQ3_LARCR|nr:hypothetical protein D5F01_LYC09316 [Larimichthys crocea]
MSSVYCGIEEIFHVLTSLIPVDPSLALKPANNQCERKKLAGIEEEGVVEEKGVEADEERTVQEEAVIKNEDTAEHKGEEMEKGVAAGEKWRPEQEVVVTGSCVGKTVDVWVVNGQSLTGDGPLNDPEPYVKVSIGSQIRTTSVIHSSSNPSWWEEFRFFNASGNMLKIEIWEADSGLRGDDDHLGTCTEQLISGGAQYHAIQCRASDSGYVKVIYKCF